MTAKRRYFVAVNQYRSSTDAGFPNTWRVRECYNAGQQRRILVIGLPVRDLLLERSNGCWTPAYTTVGVRAATASEIRYAKKYDRPDMIQHHFDGDDTADDGQIDPARDAIEAGCWVKRVL